MKNCWSLLAVRTLVSYLQHKAMSGLRCDHFDGDASQKATQVSNTHDIGSPAMRVEPGEVPTYRGGRDADRSSRSTAFRQAIKSIISNRLCAAEEGIR